MYLLNANFLHAELKNANELLKIKNYAEWTVSFSFLIFIINF